MGRKMEQYKEGLRGRQQEASEGVGRTSPTPSKGGEKVRNKK